MLDHSPEIVKGRCERTLSGNHVLSSHNDRVSVYVVVHGVVVSEAHSGWVEGHEGRVAVEGELFWVFVEFVDVILGLGHEREEFKLSSSAAGHAFEGELYEFDWGAHFLEIFVFVNPLLRDVIEIHIIYTSVLDYLIIVTVFSLWNRQRPTRFSVLAFNSK